MWSLTPLTSQVIGGWILAGSALFNKYATIHKRGSPRSCHFSKWRHLECYWRYSFEIILGQHSDRILWIYCRRTRYYGILHDRHIQQLQFRQNKRMSIGKSGRISLLHIPIQRLSCSAWLYNTSSYGYIFTNLGVVTTIDSIGISIQPLKFRLTL